MNHYWRIVLPAALTLLAGLIWGNGALAATDSCPVLVTVAPSKPLWGDGDAIEVKVALLNERLQVIVVPISYPSLGGAGYPGVSFSMTKDVAPAASPPSLLSVGIETNVELHPGAAWSTEIFINRYLTGIPAGRSTVFWRLLMSCSGSIGGPSGVFDRAGSFDIQIGPKNMAELKARAAEYVKSLNAREPMRRAEALEALGNFSDPFVVPFLQQVFSFGYRSDALRAMKKFSADDQVSRALQEFVSSNDSVAIATVLRAISTWRYDFGGHIIDDLMARPDVPIRLAMVEYLGARTDDASETRLKYLSADVDRMVSAAAKRQLAKRN